MVLSRNEIIEAISNNGLAIEPFDESYLTTNGYLLTANRITVPKVHWTVRKGFVAVGKMTRFKVDFQERIRLGPGFTGTMTLTTKLSTKGVIATLPRLDSGYDGNVTISAFNSSIRTIDISKGEPIVELVLDRIGGRTGQGVQMPIEDKEVPLAKVPSRTGPEARPMRGLVVDPRDTGYPCEEHRCSVCCHKTEMPLTDSDMRRIEALGHTGFWIEDGGWVSLRNVNGICYFLKNGKCSIYRNRPIGCKFYPAVYSVDEDGAIMDVECPHTEEFALTDTLSKDLRALVDTVQREARNKRRRS